MGVRLVVRQGDHVQAMGAEMTRNKYRAKPVEIDGIRFDSMAEARFYGALMLRKRAGEVAEIEIQPRFPIAIDGEPVRALPNKKGHKGRALEYRADFAFDDGGKRRVVDVKGMDTPVSRLKEYKDWTRWMATFKRWMEAAAGKDDQHEARTLLAELMAENSDRLIEFSKTSVGADGAWTEYEFWKEGICKMVGLESLDITYKTEAAE